MTSLSNFIAITKTDFELVYSLYMEDSINPYMSFEKFQNKHFKSVLS
ncbi:MAG: hypothetical protein ACJA0I_000687 [Gammaproteobacteria bacterium]|jgi:hypothetical protein